MGTITTFKSPREPGREVVASVAGEDREDDADAAGKQGETEGLQRRLLVAASGVRTSLPDAA